MSMPTIAISKTGLVTSIGLSAPASCAAVRARISNPTETRFIDSSGEWIMAHQVQLDQPWRGHTKHVKMAAMALAECLDGLPREECTDIPLMLCLAEVERRGRIVVDAETFIVELQEELGAVLHSHTRVIAAGHVSIAMAIDRARALFRAQQLRRVVVLAIDSFLVGGALSHYEKEGRLLTDANSNGFMPGEAAGALLLETYRPDRGAQLFCRGIGFGIEDAPLGSGMPLRANGLTRAIREALQDAGSVESILQFKIIDAAGEQYYFKEASLAFSRLDRTKRKEFDVWHPSDCVGEVGAAAGAVMIAVLKAACEKKYVKGDHILLHLGNDDGRRASMIFSWTPPE